MCAAPILVDAIGIFFVSIAILGHIQNWVMSIFCLKVVVEHANNRTINQKRRTAKATRTAK